MSFAFKEHAILLFKDVMSELRTKLEQEAAEDSFSGAVLVARNGASAGRIARFIITSLSIK
jgi:hypothetical protein